MEPSLYLMLALSATPLSIGNKIEHTIVVDILDIDPLWDEDLLPFALLTETSYQYITYYDVQRN